MGLGVRVPRCYMNSFTFKHAQSLQKSTQWNLCLACDFWGQTFFLCWCGKQLTVDMLNSVTYLDWTPNIVKWYVVMCSSKNTCDWAMCLK